MIVWLNSGPWWLSMIGGAEIFRCNCDLVFAISGGGCCWWFGMEMSAQWVDMDSYLVCLPIGWLGPCHCRMKCGPCQSSAKVHWCFSISHFDAIWCGAPMLSKVPWYPCWLAMMGLVTWKCRDGFLLVWFVYQLGGWVPATAEWYVGHANLLLRFTGALQFDAMWCGASMLSKVPWYPCWLAMMGLVTWKCWHRPQWKHTHTHTQENL